MEERKPRTHLSHDTGNQKEPRERPGKLLHHLRLHGSHLVRHHLHATLHDPHPLVVGGLVSHVPTGNRPRVQRKKELPDRRHLHGQHGQQSLASGRHLILVNRAGHAGLITPCWKV